MAQLYTIGRVTADFNLKIITNKFPYIRFNVADKIGYGKAAKTQFLQVWAYGDDAKRIVKAGVKKGSLIWISGSLELEEFEKLDKTADKRLKVTLDTWGYVPIGKSKNGTDGQNEEAGEELSSDCAPGGEIDGDREELPN